jgi:hypothetical protein
MRALQPMTIPEPSSLALPNATLPDDVFVKLIRE